MGRLEASVRLNRSSLRFRIGDAAVGAVAAGIVLGLTSACGGAGGAAPTPTVAPAASAAPAVAPSPQRPPLASPAASPSAGAVVVASPSAIADAAGGTDYEVASGDTLLTIATEKYGDSAQWRRIYDANRDVIGADPDQLKIGMKLKIPPKQ